MMSETDFNAEVVAERVSEFLNNADDGERVQVRTGPNRTQFIRSDDSYSVDVSGNTVYLKDPETGTVRISLTDSVEFVDELPELCDENGVASEDGEPVMDGSGSAIREKLETELIQSLSGTRLEVSATDHHAYSGAKVMGVDGDELVYGGPVWSPSVEDPEATSKFAEFKFSTVEPGDVFQFGVHYGSPGFEDRDEADLLAHHSYLKDADETLFYRVQDGEVEVISEDEVFQHISEGQADE